MMDRNGTKIGLFQEQLNASADVASSELPNTAVRTLKTSSLLDFCCFHNLRLALTAIQSRTVNCLSLFILRHLSVLLLSSLIAEKYFCILVAVNISYYYHHFIFIIVISRTQQMYLQHQLRNKLCFSVIKQLINLFFDMCL